MVLTDIREIAHVQCEAFATAEIKHQRQDSISLQDYLLFCSFLSWGHNWFCQTSEYSPYLCRLLEITFILHLLFIVLYNLENIKVKCMVNIIHTLLGLVKFQQWHVTITTLDTFCTHRHLQKSERRWFSELHSILLIGRMVLSDLHATYLS